MVAHLAEKPHRHPPPPTEMDGTKRVGGVSGRFKWQNLLDFANECIAMWRFDLNSRGEQE